MLKIRDDYPELPTLPPLKPDPASTPTDWAGRLKKRILALRPGRYTITLTVGRDPDWTVTELGKLER